MPNLILVTNCVIHSLDASDSKYEALVIDGAKIAAVGSMRELTADHPDADVMDLGGAHVFPGFVDAHAHIYGMGDRVTRPRLEGTRSKEEVYNVLRPLIGQSEWIVSRGWNQNVWEEKVFPTRHDLDAHVSREQPIALTRIDGHAMWGNSKALEIAGITGSSTAPLGGAIELDAAGEPTGILLDEAMTLIESRIPSASIQEMKQTLRAGLQYFAKKGHVGVHEMGVTAELWQAFEELYDEEGQDLPRAYVFLDMTKPTGKELFLELFERGTGYRNDPESRLQLVGIKLYLDGALGSRGAELFEDYTDDPGNRGLALMEDADVIRLFQIAARHKLQIAVHAIGDKANARALSLFEEAGVSRSGAILRIEHAQIVRDEEVPKFAGLGVYALVQPAFFSSDRHWAVDRLGAQRMKTAYRWRSLIDAGARLVSSSDAPIEDPDPLEAIRVLTGRDGVPDGEELTAELAIRAYAQYPYELSVETNVAGRLETGMRADMTVVIPGIDQRVESPNAEILATIVGGADPLRKERRVARVVI